MSSPTDTQPPQYSCSFCGKRLQEVRRLVSGPGPVHICNECVDLCRDIMSEDDLNIPLSGVQQEGRQKHGTDASGIENRKADHIRICLEEDVAGQGITT